jgi:hypothetical protein
MNKTTELIHAYIEQGGNLKLLLMATGIDESTFRDKLEWSKWDSIESRDIRRAIREWEEVQ